MVPQDIPEHVTWAEFLEIVVGKGFTVVWTNEYIRTGFPYHEIIAAHLEKKLLLYARSYEQKGEELLGGGRIYGTVSRGEISPSEADELLVGSKDLTTLETIWFTISLISREPFTTLARIEEKMRFVDWKGSHQLVWILNYSEEEEGHPAKVNEWKWRLFLETSTRVKSFIV